MPDNQPVIVAFVSDLMLLTRIEAVCQRLNFEVRAVGSAADVAPGVAKGPPRQAGEPVYGQEAALVDTLTEWQPALLIFNLANEAVPWRDWIALIRSGPATRRIPIVAFGPHVNPGALESATDRGADLAVPRSRFMSAMPALISEHARSVDLESLAQDCSRALSGLAVEGLLAFNRGDYFEAHEHLEDAWNADDGATRDLHKGVLQVAVAYLQIQRGNYPGAVKMFLRARQWLGPLPERCRGINIAQLRRDAETVHQEVLRLGPGRLGELDPALLRPVDFDSQQA